MVIFIKIKRVTQTMDNGCGATVFVTVTHRHAMLTTSAECFLFVSPGRIIYNIFVVTVEIFEALYREMVVVSFSFYVGR